MLVICGRVGQPTPVEWRGMSDDANLVNYKNNIALNKGGVPSDYDLATLSETSPIALRIRAGDEFTLIWNGNQISGADFSTFDAKGKIRFGTNKNEVLSDNIDKCRIQVKILDSLDGDTATDITGLMFPVAGPLGKCMKKVDIVAGSVIFDFKTTMAGTWYFPAPGTLMVGNYRVKNQIVVEVLLV